MKLLLKSIGNTMEAICFKNSSKQKETTFEKQSIQRRGNRVCIQRMLQQASSLHQFVKLLLIPKAVRPAFFARPKVKQLEVP